MLSEGWDVNAVTHILGIRAFSTKLLCEQVIGRGLRRRSYEVVKTLEGDRFRAEYAEVYGVPFDFYPAEGGRGRAASGFSTMVCAVPERQDRMEITFPIIVGYRRDGRPANFEGDLATGAIRSLAKALCGCDRDDNEGLRRRREADRFSTWSAGLRNMPSC